jgi:hypothetical protein
LHTHTCTGTDFRFSDCVGSGENRTVGGDGITEEEEVAEEMEEEEEGWRHRDWNQVWKRHDHDVEEAREPAHGVEEAKEARRNDETAESEGGGEEEEKRERVRKRGRQSGRESSWVPYSAYHSGYSYSRIGHPLGGWDGREGLGEGGGREGEEGGRSGGLPLPYMRSTYGPVYYSSATHGPGYGSPFSKVLSTVTWYSKCNRTLTF